MVVCNSFDIYIYICSFCRGQHADVNFDQFRFSFVFSRVAENRPYSLYLRLLLVTSPLILGYDATTSSNTHRPYTQIYIAPKIVRTNLKRCRSLQRCKRKIHLGKTVTINIVIVIQTFIQFIVANVGSSRRCRNAGVSPPSIQFCHQQVGDARILSTDQTCWKNYNQRTQLSVYQSSVNKSCILEWSK